MKDHRARSMGDTASAVGSMLLFVLFATAGIYFQLNYSFLGAVQLLVYAGGITVLYVFSILLTSSQGDKAEDLKGYKLFAGLAATLAMMMP